MRDSGVVASFGSVMVVLSSVAFSL